MSPWFETILTKSMVTRYKNKHGGYCSCYHCGKKLASGDRFVLRDALSKLKNRYYCPKCGKELNLI